MRDEWRTQSNAEEAARRVREGFAFVGIMEESALDLSGCVKFSKLLSLLSFFPFSITHGRCATSKYPPQTSMEPELGPFMICRPL